MSKRRFKVFYDSEVRSIEIEVDKWFADNPDIELVKFRTHADRGYVCVTILYLE